VGEQVAAQTQLGNVRNLVDRNVESLLAALALAVRGQ
jgi:hypothetical protein